MFDVTILHETGDARLPYLRKLRRVSLVSKLRASASGGSNLGIVVDIGRGSRTHREARRLC